MKYIISTICLIISLNSYSFEVFLPEELLEQRNLEFEKLSDEAKKVAAGADIIGNGGGLAEQNILYLFRQLDRYLVLCLNHYSCLSDDTDRSIVRKLVNLSIQKRRQRDAVLFLNESDFDDFFDNLLDPGERLAKTGFSSKFPIFFNVSSIYKNGLENDSSFLLGLIIHELGHQLGIGSHTFLDRLAVKVRTVFENYYNKFSVRFGALDMTFAHFSDQSLDSFDQGVLTVKNSSFSFSVGDSYNCPGDDSLVGSKWFNPHFMKPLYFKNELTVGMRVWAEMYCKNLSSGNIYSETVTTKFEFHLEKSPGGGAYYKLLEFKATHKDN